MRDEDFEVFIEEFGEAFDREGVPPESLDLWRGKLPPYLLRLWSEEGWSGYADGLFWFVNPDDYEEIVDAWVTETPLSNLDKFHVFARSAFGDLYLCGEKSGSSATISTLLHSIIAVPGRLNPKSEHQKDISIKSFLLSSKDGFDFKDASDKYLFRRAVKELGPLERDEMFGFEPAIVAGGKPQLDNLRKFKIDQHVTILRQLAPPNIPFSNVDIDRLLKS